MDMSQSEREVDLVLMDVEAAELLLLPFTGDGERTRDELVHQSSHHFSKGFWRSEREREREAEEIGSRINYSNMGEKRTLACLGIILLFCLLFPFWVNFHFKFHLIHYFEFEFIFILVIYASKFFISKNKNKSSEFFILTFMFLEVYHEW